MALATYQLQGSSSSFPSVSSSWSGGSKLKHSLPTLHAVGGKQRFISLKCRSCLSVGASFDLGPKSKLFKISAFKGSRHDDSGGRANGTNSLKKPAKVSYLQHEGEDSLVESPKVQHVAPAPYTSVDETTSRSRAIQKLFKHWLMLLRTSPQTEPVDEVLEEPSSTGTSEVVDTVQNQERNVIPKSVWSYFLDLDATIKIPLLIFTPLYLAVNFLYGSEVSKELTPLWIVGPLVVALYIKIFHAICSLYIFSFKQTVKVVRNLPTYYSFLQDCIAEGKLKETMQKHIWQPLEDLKNANYKKLSLRIMKDLLGWLVERYLDFVESIWPYYCRTIRFLKRANFI